MDLIMDSEFNRIKLEHSYAFEADTLKLTKTEEDIVIKCEVLGETNANRGDEYFDLYVPSVSQKFKSYSCSKNTTLLSDVSDECEFNNQTNHLELKDNCNITNTIRLSVLANDDSGDIDAKGILECHQKYQEMKTEEKICRFCFKMCCNFKIIHGDIKVVSDVLLPGIDLAAIQEPVMCTHCEEVLFLSFDFKARCFHTYDYLIPFATKEDDGVKLNLKDIYMIKHKNNISGLEDQDICGFCMCPVRNCSAIFFDGERDIMLRKTLEQCLPELDISIIEEPVICASCRASLENHFRFVTNVLIVEEKIKKYKASLDINSKSRIDLSSLVPCMLSEVDSNGGDIIKLEKTFCDYNESVDKEVELNCNAMNTDDLRCNNEQKSTPTNMLDCKIKRNEIDAIKTEETFCPVDGTEFREENIVEQKDQEILRNEEIVIKTDELDFNSFEDAFVRTQLNDRLNGKKKCSVLPNFEDVLLELHIDQTCTNKNATKITPYLYKCDPFKTEHKYDLKTHLLKHRDRSEMTIYKCPSCSFQTYFKEFLKIHSLRLKDLFKVIMYKCHSCTYQTKYKSFHKRHLMEHSNSEETMYKCDSCSYQTKHKPLLKRHLLKHMNSSEVIMHKCDLCLYQTKHKPEFKRHLLKHKNPSEVTMHKCDSCVYQTIHKSALKRHLLKHKDISEVAVYKCDSCLYLSKYKSQLKTHLLTHKKPSEIIMHKCDSCAYQTKRKSYLKTHFMKHKIPSGVIMHRCNSCAYQTICKKYLKSHLLKHKNPSEVTMHKCDSCGYQTIYKSALKRHFLKHKDI